MAKLNLKALPYLLVIAVLGLCVISCNSKQKPKKQIFELSGTIKNLKEGKLVVRIDYHENLYDTIQVKEGKFTYSRDFPVPKNISLTYGDFLWNASFFAENSKMTLVGDLKNRRATKITGGKFQLAMEEYKKAAREYRKGKPSAWKLREKLYNPKLSKKEKAEVEAQMKKIENDYLNFQKSYIQKNPKNPYGAYIIWNRLTTKSGGESAKSLAEWAKPIDPSIRKHPFVAKMFKMLNTMLKTEAGLGKFVKDAPNVKYKVDKNYKGGIHKSITYLSIFKNNDICALSANAGLHIDVLKMDQKKVKEQFFIKMIAPNGVEKSQFELKEEGTPSVIAVDANDNIYVLNTLQKEIVRKMRGREMKQKINIGVHCYIYNKEGKKLKDFKLDKLKQATGARIFEDKLLISDVGMGALVIYNKETGKQMSTIKDLRPCCSILDFDVDKKGQIIVANLGSFRVDGYDFNGKKLVSFGQRGKGMNDFSGCCNPVSVRKIDNGAIITVEKTPTRIKVYSKEGAKSIKGIEELVKGCFHIPIMSDSDNNIYLASPEKGLVKCVVM